MELTLFAFGLILGFAFLNYWFSGSRALRDKVKGVYVPKKGGTQTFSSPQEAVIEFTSVGQVVWISAEPLKQARVHTVRPGASVEEALALIKKLAALSPTVVVASGLAGLEAAGSIEPATAVLDELKVRSPVPVHIFLPDGRVAG